MTALSPISPRFSLLFLLFVLLFPSQSPAAVLTKDTIWEGEVKVVEDVLVPKGVTLTVRAGTVVTVVAAESTKTDPEYLSPLTEIAVRGTLKVEGTEKAPVEFSGEEKRAGSWAGIIIDGGTASLGRFAVKNAETGIHLLDGKLQVGNGAFQENRYGLVIQGKNAEAVVEDSRITGNDYGVFTLQGAHLATTSVTVSGNRKKDSYTASTRGLGPGGKRETPEEIPVSRRYGDEAFRGDTIWQGRIEVAGTVRVAEGSRLIILPGTIVEFTKKDTSGVGIGENGLLIQGRLIAKGTREQPIVFRSAEKEKNKGDWDAINIMNSSVGQNLIEHCRIENAYRGLHFHFSNVAVRDTVLSNNYRAIQFQESLVDMQGNELFGNSSGIQGRDSDISFLRNVIHDNFQGANFLRCNLVARGNRVVGNGKEGLRVREGTASLQENLIDGNRQGLLVADMYYGDYSRNSITNNLEAGLSLKNVDNIEVRDNFIGSNGLTGINMQEARALIKGNQIADNGERGIGVLSFSGVITENNFIKNGTYAVDLDGAGDAAAPLNWWGGDDPAQVVLDKARDGARGRVDTASPAYRPFHFVWPLEQISADVTWRGIITVKKPTAILAGTSLTVAPATTIEFSRGAGLAIKGKLVAKGSAGGKITFTSVEKKGPSDWDEVLLEYATGSALSHCVFEYATWGLHSHFTNLAVSDSLFRNNFGGMRFRSGPVDISRSRFEHNTIGIRAYLGNATIRHNVITNNETGIFVREKGGGLTIARNNIYANSNYNVRIGDFNAEDVNARENWWGSDEPLQTFFDGRNEPGIGNVIFEPFFKEPLNAGEGVAQ